MDGTQPAKRIETTILKRSNRSCRDFFRRYRNGIPLDDKGSISEAERLPPNESKADYSPRRIASFNSPASARMTPASARVSASGDLLKIGCNFFTPARILSKSGVCAR